jgi:hypothetical protein
VDSKFYGRHDYKSVEFSGLPSLQFSGLPSLEFKVISKTRNFNIN